MITKDLEKAIACLNSDGIIGLPTETVYGIAANGLNERAVKKIFEIKKRPLTNPLILHVSSIERLKDIAEEVPPKAKALAEKFWPGSLTMLLKKKASVPDSVTAGHPTVAVRIPNHTMTLELLEKLSFPLAAPSANPFSRVSSTTANQVEKYFGESLPVILDGGSCTVGIESTIVGFYEDEVVIHRLGGISVEQIEEVVGKVKILDLNDSAPIAPGMLKKHYSPITNFICTEDVMAEIQNNPGKKIGLLLFKNDLQDFSEHVQVVLSAKGDLAEATRKLYQEMSKLDEMNLDLIIAEKFPGYGLGKSLNDKLNRAASN
jgi:L-threonylcarbamoyladenylate synthase